jgi:(2Fe-2S) ferredoxin
MGKKKKLRKVRESLPPDAVALAVCVGKKCAPREDAEALYAYAARRAGAVRVARAKCLGVCEDGPIVATLPAGEFVERARPADVDRLLDRLARDVAAARGDRPIAIAIADGRDGRGGPP